MSCKKSEILNQFYPKSASNEILEAASREAAVLTDQEREIILAVLTKDELLRKDQQVKILHLKAELQNLRRKGALKVSSDWNQTGPDPARTCNRCRIEFGRVFNRGADCRSCRLRVCKSCREYNFRTTDWVCIVCFKRMEIQAASGEWMNEFVRRPSRRKDAKVYVPTADIIKRTIRRSWTISNPTPRWTFLRNSTEYRPYNSLPRDQDINNYPSLAFHQTKNHKKTNSSSSPSSTRRTKSEDVYMDDHNEATTNNLFVENNFAKEIQNEKLTQPAAATRINPLMSISLRENRNKRQRRKSPSSSSGGGDKDDEEEIEDKEKERRRGRSSPQAHSKSIQQSSLEYPTGNLNKRENDNNLERSATLPDTENRNKFHERRHVSFDNSKNDISDMNYFRSHSLSSSPNRKTSKGIRRNMAFTTTKLLPDDGCTNNNFNNNNNINNNIREDLTSSFEIRNSNENGTIELCDIEPMSGTVFRKMTVSRRKQETLRKMPAVDAGWRRTPETDLFDILLPDGEDYRLVFVNSDSSSKEEDNDDNDSSSASSFPIDECDWDYFEPGASSRSPRSHPTLSTSILESNSQSPFGSPGVHRKKNIHSLINSPNLNRRSNIKHSVEEEQDGVNVPSPFETGPLRSATLESIEALQCVHQHQNTTGQQTDQNTHPVTSCKTCGGSSMPTAQYIPIPVPVPIPFPVPWGANLSIDTSGSNLVPLYRSLPNLTRNNTQQSMSEFWKYFAHMQGGGYPWNFLEKQMINERNASVVKEKNEMKKKKDNENRDIEKNNYNEVYEDEPKGYLDCENRGSSDSSEDESLSSSSDQHQTTKRVYNISGSPTDRDSDDALPSSSTVSSDNEEVLDNKSSADEKEREDVEEDEAPSSSSSSSSGSADTDSNDTGTVADQKSKRFSRVFVVNNKDSNESSASIVTSSGDYDTDSSDNDTDLDGDCTGVVLTNIKQIDLEVVNQEADNSNKNKNDTDTDGKATFLSIRYIGEDGDNSGSNPLSTTNSPKDASHQERKSKKKNRPRRHSKTKIKEINGNNTLRGRQHDCDNLRKQKNKTSKSEYCLNKPTENIEKEEGEEEMVEERRSLKANIDPSCDSKLNKILDVIIDSEMISPVSENIISATEKRNHLDIGNFNVEIDKKRTRESVIDDIKPKQEINELAPKPNDKQSLTIDAANIQNINYGTQTEPPLNHFYFNDSSNNMYSSSPGLSDVSAESLSSSDAEKEESARTCNHQHAEWGEIAATASLMKPLATIESIKVVDEKSVAGNLPGDGSACSVGYCTDVSQERSVHNNDDGSSLVDSSGGSKYSLDSLLNQHDTTAPATSPAAVAADAAAAAKYTSLVMIRNDNANDELTTANKHYHQQVNVVTSDTTKVIPGSSTINSSSASAVGSDCEPVVVVVSHTNRQNDDEISTPMDTHNLIADNENFHQHHPENNVTVITSAETLSAFEEGLADDDSWVENLSYGDEEEDEEEDDDEDDFPTNSISENSSSGDEVTLTCSAAIDQEDELRGYHRAAIDFTLHTIVEESCEESEVEQAPPKKKKERPPSATDLEKYFFFRLGDGTVPSSINSNREDAYSETSSIYSEGMESLGGAEENHQNENPEELASSRLEKYFLSGFMGFTAERRDSDGSVGSDSEGKPSPEQRRKRLVRARGTGRSHSSSLDNLLANPDLAGSEQQLDVQNNSEHSSNSDSDTYDEMLNFDKSDGQFDTVKRKKGKKQKASSEDTKNLETTQEEQEDKESDIDDDRNKTPQPEVHQTSNLTTNKNQQSRDSGFVGSCDDLLKDQRDVNKSPEISFNNEKSLTNVLAERKGERALTESLPPATNLTRKDSFNNWSSDEETNLMMCKMRQFFKTMVANNDESSQKPSTPNLSSHTSPKPIPRGGDKARSKPPQLVYFENELTRLMKTVPGIRDDQVREIVEYLSSEDTWSDSYDSSDYTSSDLEGASNKSALQQQISDSCKQIINKFDSNLEDEEGDAGDGGIVDEGHGLNKETAFVYQKLVASFEKIATEDRPPSNSGPNSPPLIAKVMHHIGSRLVALMHEVSSGESHASNSPRVKNYHRKLQPKISNASTTTDDDTSDNISEHLLEEPPMRTNCNMLLRSRSHDLLIAESGKNLNQSISGTSEISEERETSDCERFSWRGSFESALLAADSRNKLSLIGGEGSASASALAIAAKRRSAGDLLFNHKSLSREQLDRVRSCGSIGGGNSEDKLWVAPSAKSNRRRSSVPDTACCESGASADGEDEDDEMENRATLPRSIQSGPQTTNSLPRLPTTSITTLQKAQSHHFLPQQNAKSARYRPPGFSRLIPSQPKRAVSAPGLQPSHQRRGRRSQVNYVPSDDVSLSEAHSSPMLASSRAPSKSATPSPVAPSSRKTTGTISSQEWASNDDDIDRLVAMHHTRSSLSSLGLRSDSMASVYSGAGEGRYGSVTVRGQVEFGLQYNYKSGSLEIQIKQCKDLAPVDSKRNRSDPYVKVYLLPDKSKSGKRKTKVKKHTLNPVFDECLKFHMSLNELELRTLWLTVWHSDMFGRNDFLGEVMMTLENKVFDDPTPKWYNLQERTEPFDDILSFKGDIIVCLKFVPPDMTVHKKGKRSRGSLHVLIKEAKALTAVKANGTSDPFCKSYLLPDKGRSSKQKTSVIKRTVNPVWNHTFIYDDVTLQELAERSLELTVWDHDRLASNEFLGGVRFSLGTGKHYGKVVEWMDATGKEVSLWKNMLERPNFWVEGSLSLRPTLDTRIS